MSDTSTKRAEEIAYNLQLSGVSGSTWRATEVDASNMLRALAAERDALRAENDKLRAENAKLAASNHAYLSNYQEAVDEIEKLRAAICEWAASIYGYEGVLFLEGLQHEKFINSILDAERDRVEGEQKE
jgi:hypothetical protein